MNKEKEIENKMKFLVDLINKWNHEYYVLNNPSVSDSVYDQNYNLLREIENQSGVILGNSPTLKVGPGSELNEANFSKVPLKLVKRKKPMISIDNVNTFEGIHKFDSRVKKEAGVDVEYVCELKIDGISASIMYENGIVKQVSTRGNGFIGEDVTENKFLISDLPQKQLSEKNCEVRGEVYMSIKEFESVNKTLSEKGVKTLSNARNAVSGSLRSLLSKNDDFRTRKLNFFSYQFLPSEKFKTQEECLLFLEKESFPVSTYKLCYSIKDVEDFIKETEEKRKRLGFLIDGVVVKVNSYEICSKLGETNKFPRWSIAYKFVSSEFSTTIEKITSAVGKNGRVSYVASVTPFYLDGSLIRRVTLHNYAFIKSNSINISDEILVKKSGDVIPQISKVLKKNQDGVWIPQEFCLSCSSKLLWNENNVYQICTNNNCPEKVINYLCFCVSKFALNIKGVSKSTIKKIHDQGILNKQADFYELWKEREKLSKVFREKTLNNIIDSIDKSKNQELSRVITSFSIPLLSFYKAKIVSKFFLEDIVNFLERMKNKRDDFSLLRKLLGEKTFKSFEWFFSNNDNLTQLERLSTLIDTKS